MVLVLVSQPVAPGPGSPHRTKARFTRLLICRMSPPFCRSLCRRSYVRSPYATTVMVKDVWHIEFFTPEAKRRARDVRHWTSSKIQCHNGLSQNGQLASWMVPLNIRRLMGNWVCHPYSAEIDRNLSGGGDRRDHLLISFSVVLNLTGARSYKF